MISYIFLLPAVWLTYTLSRSRNALSSKRNSHYQAADEGIEKNFSNFLFYRHRFFYSPWKLFSTDSSFMAIYSDIALFKYESSFKLTFQPLHFTVSEKLSYSFWRILECIHPKLKLQMIELIRKSYVDWNILHQ